MLHTPASGAVGQLHNPLSIILRGVCGNRARIPGPCTYSYKSAFLLFGCRARRGSAGPGKWGCVRVQEGVARVQPEQPPCPAGAVCWPQTTASSAVLDQGQDSKEEALVTFSTWVLNSNLGVQQFQLVIFLVFLSGIGNWYFALSGPRSFYFETGACYVTRFSRLGSNLRSSCIAGITCVHYHVSQPVISV